MLVDFCQLMVRKYGWPKAIDDEVLAREFADHFRLSPLPTLEELRHICRELGIDVAARKLPPDIAAHHYPDRLARRYRLEYGYELWVGTAEFRVSHDVYEIIQETFEKVCPGYEAPRNPALPTCMAPHANKFAAALVINEKLMRRWLLDTGFDILALQHRFHKAYSAVAIRVVEVLQEAADDNIQVLIAIYERNEPERDISLWGDCSREKFQVTYVARTPGIKMARKGSWVRVFAYPRHVLPRKGDKVVPGGIVDAVINETRPLYIERVTGFDFWSFNDLVCLAVPVVWHRRETGVTVLAKVILIVMPYEQASMLEPQLQRLRPAIIPERVQFI
jgi:hypothetical protein